MEIQASGEDGARVVQLPWLEITGLRLVGGAPMGSRGGGGCVAHRASLLDASAAGRGVHGVALGSS